MKHRFIIALWVLISISGLADKDFNFRARHKADQFLVEIAKIRHRLHQVPEPCFQEEETARIITAYLTEWGLDVTVGIAKTGIKAVLRGRAPQPVVAVRADMDALPITEATGLDFASRNEGMMHACGHDFHMANALMAAKILASLKESLPGTVVFIFQPCEEGTSGRGRSGAPMLIDAGVLENPVVERIVGLHLMPGYPVGSVALKPGPLMANVASVFISIRGTAAHGAYPHQGIDAIYAASAAIVQFQSIISRMKNPAEEAVFTIGTIQGGVRLNVIADHVRMEGTVRTFSFDTQAMIRDAIQKTLSGLETTHGVKSELEFIEEAKFVNNHAGLTEKALQLFRRLLGADRVFLTDPVTVGEDFAFYSHRIPALFFFLGTGDSGDLHSATFNPDETILRYGGWLLACLARDLLDYGEMP